jgi:hypothetical protein
MKLFDRFTKQALLLAIFLGGVNNSILWLSFAQCNPFSSAFAISKQLFIFNTQSEN